MGVKYLDHWGGAREVQIGVAAIKHGPGVSQNAGRVAAYFHIVIIFPNVKTAWLRRAIVASSSPLEVGRVGIVLESKKIGVGRGYASVLVGAVFG